MLPKKNHSKEKSRLHPRNKHRERYDFKLLIEVLPELASYVKVNIYEDETIDFFDPEAVKMLNTALLKKYYAVENWNIPSNYLCPPIPGRADYIHYIADLLCSKNYGKIPIGNSIKCLDVGVGANCIYPIIGNHEYSWSFVGTDIDPVSIESATKIIQVNPHLIDVISVRLQENKKDIFRNIIQNEELFDVMICNPPFHSSEKNAEEGSRKKVANLTKKETTSPILNFGGQQNELWCEGGEIAFVSNIVRQSKEFASSCFWFSSLISKESNLKAVYEILNRLKATEIKTIPMGQGNKTSRIVTWTFLTPEEQKNWAKTRWNLNMQKVSNSIFITNSIIKNVLL